MLREAWKKAVAIAGIVVAVWLATPVPEVTIVAGVLGGKTLSTWIPWWLSWPGAATGAVIGWYFDVPKKVYQLLGRNSQDGA